MGRIVDKKLARNTPCTCYSVSSGRACGDPKECPGDYMCFSQGVLGTMSDPQDEKYCPNHDTKYSKKLKGRVDKFRKWGKLADVCLEEGVNFKECIIREAKRL